MPGLDDLLKWPIEIGRALLHSYPAFWDRLLKDEEVPIDTPTEEIRRKTRNVGIWRSAWKWFGIPSAVYALVLAENWFPWDTIAYGLAIALASSYLVCFHSVRGRIGPYRQSIAGAIWIMAGFLIPLVCWRFVNRMLVPDPMRDFPVNCFVFFALAVINVVTVLSIQRFDRCRKAS